MITCGAIVPSYLTEVAGPTAPPKNSAERNATSFYQGVDNPQLVSSIKSLWTAYLNQPLPFPYRNWTVKFFYHGVLDVINLEGDPLDMLMPYSFVIQALVQKKMLQPLNPFYLGYQSTYGYSPGSEMPKQSLYDLCEGLTCYVIPFIYQNLAFSVNVTTLAAINDTLAPPPVGNMTTQQWTHAELSYLANEMYQAGVLEPVIMEECMIFPRLTAWFLSHGIPFISEDGKSSGWRDPRVIDIIETELLPLIHHKHEMVARWVNLATPDMQAYVSANPSSWPPSQPVYMDRGTCGFATQAPGFVVLFLGAHPEIQRLYSPGLTNTIQTHGLGIPTNSRYPAMAWDFMQFQIACEHPNKVMLNRILAQKAVPFFQTCRYRPDVQAAIAANPSATITQNERDKSFPVTYDRPAPLASNLFEQDGVALMLLSALMWGVGIHPRAEFNPVGYQIVPYGSIPSISQAEIARRQGFEDPNFDIRAAITQALEYTVTHQEFLLLPVCQYPDDVWFSIGPCDGTGAPTTASWNLFRVNISCRVDADAETTLAAAAPRTTNCPYMNSSEAFSIGTTLAAIILVLQTGIAFIMILQRKHSAIISGSWLLSLVLLGGLILIAIASLLPLSEAPCWSWPVVFSCGLSLALACMAMKLWRLNNIFNNSTISVRRITDVKLLLGVAAIFMGNVIFMALWLSGRDGDKIYGAAPQFGDGTITLDVLYCNNGDAVVLTAWLIYFICLWLFNVIMGWKVRNVIEDFTDSKFINYITFALSAILILFVPILLALNSPQTITVIEIAVSLYLAFAMTIGYFYRKIFIAMLRSNNKLHSIAADSSDKSGTGRAMSGTSVGNGRLIVHVQPAESVLVSGMPRKNSAHHIPSAPATSIASVQVASPDKVNMISAPLSAWNDK